MFSRDMKKENWDNLSKEEKDYWEGRAKSFTDIEKLWMILCLEKKCIWCGKEFEDGIIKKNAKKFVPLNSYCWFTPEFLVHAQTTHGYSPDIIDIFLGEIK